MRFRSYCGKRSITSCSEAAVPAETMISISNAPVTDPPVGTKLARPLAQRRQVRFHHGDAIHKGIVPAPQRSNENQQESSGQTPATPGQNCHLGTNVCAERSGKPMAS